MTTRSRHATGLSRRALVLAALALPFIGRRADAAVERVKIRDLWAARGAFSDLATEMNGRAVSVHGYMAPPLKPEIDFFVLTRIPMAVCPFCDSEASWPEDLVLCEVAAALSPVPFNDLIKVTGTLDIGTKTDAATGFVSRVRLVGADFERV